MKLLVLLCALAVPPGTHHIMLTTYYAHEDINIIETERPYTHSTSRYITGPGAAQPVAQGHPVAFQWWIDGKSSLTCGEIPIPDSWRVFSDGFESGDLSAWQVWAQ